MKNSPPTRFLLALFIIFSLPTSFIPAFAQPDTVDKTLEISSQLFMSFQYQTQNQNTQNMFTLKRGYLTFKRNINNKLSARFTQDITLDKEGTDAGNLEMRLKYCYLKAEMPNIGFLNDVFIEAGLVHRPWLPFEQKINKFRVQGEMYLDKFHIINGADFGATLFADIGTKLQNQTYKYASGGKFGQVSLGIYNGGGYHAIELNQNKIIEGRLSLRPLPAYLPGLMFSYNFAYGKTNLEQELPFMLSHVYVSYESQSFIIAAQAHLAEGSYEDTYYDIQNQTATFNSGYSFFTDFTLPQTKFGIYARFDYFKNHAITNETNQVLIGGFTYRFQQNLIMLDLEQHQFGNSKIQIAEIALELRF